VPRRVAKKRDPDTFLMWNLTRKIRYRNLLPRSFPSIRAQKTEFSVGKFRPVKNLVRPMEACSVRPDPIKILSSPGLSSSPAAWKQSSTPTLRIKSLVGTQQPREFSWLSERAAAADLTERVARTTRAPAAGDVTRPRRRRAALGLDDSAPGDDVRGSGRVTTRGGERDAAISTSGAVLSGNGLLPFPLLPHMDVLVPGD
jgi:hypothetical protein